MALLVTTCLAPQSASGVPLTTVRVASGLTKPLFVTHPPGDFGRVFIAEQTGKVKILDLQTGTVLATPFIDLTAVVGVGPEEGLYALAFHPDYATNGFFYVSYSNAALNSELARYEVLGDPTTSNGADPLSASILLTVPEPYVSHNIGWIAFGPNDDYLYVELGDGGSTCDPDQRAQNLNDLHGKILRLDVDSGSPYGIPPDNPFVGVPGADEIWAYGFRNPWRNAFDQVTGDLYIADVGHLNREEIDFEPASSTGGKNYGWDCMEGSACSSVSGCTVVGCTCGAAGLTLPFHEYDHSGGKCSITGGEVYRGCAIPDLTSTYFFGDYCSAQIWSLRYDGATVTDFQERTAELAPGGGLSISSLVSFGRDAFGEVYIMDLFGGEVFKIVAVGAPLEDCNSNGADDPCDIRSGASADGNSNAIPDECEGTPLDHFMFYRASRNVLGPDFYRFGPVMLQDQLGGADYGVVKAKALGVPANKNLEGIADAVTHLAQYKIGRLAGQPSFQAVQDVRVVNQCNDLLVEVKKPMSVLVPSNKDLMNPVPPPDEQDHALDHFLCYKAKAQRQASNGSTLPKFPRGIQVEAADQFESRRYDLKKVTKLCVPVAKSGSPLLMSGPNAGTPKPIDGAAIRNPNLHLLCYKAKLSRRMIQQNGCGPAQPGDPGTAIPIQPGHMPRNGVHLNNQFGPLDVNTIKAEEFCVPSFVTVP